MMAVYVDNARLKFGRMKMCHMVADTQAELLDMALKLGVLRWAQKANTVYEHFDLSLMKRKQAISLGAVEVDSRKLVSIITQKRTISGAKA